MGSADGWMTADMDYHLVIFDMVATLTDRTSNKGEVGEV